MSDENNFKQNDFDGVVTRAQGIRKSEFVGKTEIPSDARFDFISEGTNFGITIEDFQAALGVSGTIVSSSANGSPVLSVSGSINTIRNIVDGAGIFSQIDPNNDLFLRIDIDRDTTGIPLISDTAQDIPVVRSIVAGTGIGLAVDDDAITISVSSQQVPATRTVTVNSASDFPSPENGVITLEDDTNYLIANNVTVTENFQIGNNSSIAAFSPFTPTLTYVGTGTMFSGIDKNFVANSLRLNCPNANVFNLSQVSGTGILEVFNVVINSCQTLATLENLTAVIINNLQVGSVQQGFSFSGSTDTVTISQANMISTSPTFVMFNLGTSVFEALALDIPILTAPVGAVMLSGLANSGNVSVGNLATVANAKVRGGASFEDGVLDIKNSIRWGNSDNDGVGPTRPDALIFLEGNVTNTIIPAPNTPVPVAGTWQEQSVSFYSSDAAGLVTYVGERSFRAPIDATLRIQKIGGGTNDYRAALAINGVVVPQTSAEVELAGSDIGSLTVVWQHDFLMGDTVQIFIENTTDGDDVLVIDSVLRVN